MREQQIPGHFVALAIESFARACGFKVENKTAMYETQVWLIAKNKFCSPLKIGF